MRLAVIPARGGSKRIPGKNIKDFCGKPIIAHAIETAISSKLFDKVIVSTDSSEIAEVARNYGAEVPFVRPAHLADDYTITVDVINHAISWYQEKGVDLSVICCIYATSPFIRVAYLEEGYRRLMSSDKSYAFSVTSFPFPIQRAIKVNKNDEVEAFTPEYNDTRSQDLLEAFHDAGQFYWGKPEAFLAKVPFFSKDSLAVILPRYLVQDIDTLEDWKRAELMYEVIKRGSEFT